jgi:archaellum component FlaC
MDVYNKLADIWNSLGEDDEITDEQLDMIESLMDEFEEDYSRLMRI